MGSCFIGFALTLETTLKCLIPAWWAVFLGLIVETASKSTVFLLEQFCFFIYLKPGQEKNFFLIFEKTSNQIIANTFGFWVLRFSEHIIFCYRMIQYSSSELNQIFPNLSNLGSAFKIKAFKKGTYFLIFWKILRLKKSAFDWILKYSQKFEILGKNTKSFKI